MKIMKVNGTTPNFTGMVNLGGDIGHIKWDDIKRVVESTKGAEETEMGFLRWVDKYTPSKNAVAELCRVIMPGHRAHDIAKAEGVGVIIDLTK